VTTSGSGTGAQGEDASSGSTRRRDDDIGLFPGPCWCGFVSAIIAVPDDLDGVFDWCSGGFELHNQHEMTPSLLASW